MEFTDVVSKTGQNILSSLEFGAAEKDLTRFCYVCVPKPKTGSRVFSPVLWNSIPLNIFFNLATGLVTALKLGNALSLYRVVVVHLSFSLI